MVPYAYLVPRWDVCLAVVVSLVFYRYIIYRLLLSPLSRVPGPKLAGVSSLYLNHHYAKDTGVQLVKTLHDKYGPIVRVGPNEVVVRDPKQLGLIYGVRSTFPKPGTATIFENYGYPNSFSSVGREDHKVRRKQVSKVYAMHALLNNFKLLQFLDEALQKCMRTIDGNAQTPTDIYSLSGLFALDNVSFFVYGDSFKSLDGENLHISDNIRAQAIATVTLVRFFPLVACGLVWPSVLLPKFIHRAILGAASLAEANEKLVERVTATADFSSTDTALGFMQSQPDYGKTSTPGHVKSECFDHILAGADSTASSITYALYTIAKPEYHSYQDALRAEVKELAWPLKAKDVCNLPFLDACALEVLRIFAPAPGSLQQRMTPKGENTTLTINGKEWQLPPGTMIGLQAYSVHRNESVFGPDVEVFRPERWQTQDMEHLYAMKEAWITFGSGARTCIGMNLAIIELKMILATLLYQYKIDLDPASDPTDMEALLGVVIRPKNERCYLKFSKLPHVSP